jgi:hypothetical protein
MKRTLIERAGGGQDRAIGDAVLFNDVLYGFKQPIVAIEADSVHLSDLSAAEALGADARQDKQQGEKCGLHHEILGDSVRQERPA